MGCIKHEWFADIHVHHRVWVQVSLLEFLLYEAWRSRQEDQILIVRFYARYTYSVPSSDVSAQVPQWIPTACLLLMRVAISTAPSGSQ